MDEKKISIAIDGPGGAGKSTLAKKLAERLGCVYVDTGAIYRTVGLYVRRREVSPSDAEAVERLLPSLDISLAYVDGKQRMYANGEDVTDFLRTPEMSMYASAVSALPCVRAFLLESQRSLARRYSVIMDGRDIGTVVLPNADVKIFLTADERERARRRWLELREKGGEDTFEQVLADLKKRDAADSSRAVAPLAAAEDAVTLDTTELDLDESLEAMLAIIDGKLNK
ncbi:MAG: (d)CMP kinase [Oscillospiraceae bacterium]|nr:(d)CMP kinase [Oscillospiraceae bacterium]